ncbi:hypothetical protein ACWEOG_01795 [Amycolatopsis japonica]
MQDRKKRLLWTVLAVVLPGPWTPVVVIAYVLDRETQRHDEAQAYPPPDPYACALTPADRARYAPSR